MTRSAGAEGDGKRRGVVTLGVVSDLHVGATSMAGWHNRLVSIDPADYLTPTVEAIRAEQPDLVVALGDLTQVGSAEQLRSARDALDRLGCPWLACKGNHEQRGAESRRSFELVLGAHAPLGHVDGQSLPANVDALVLDALWVGDGGLLTETRPAVVVPPIRMRVADAPSLAVGDGEVDGPGRPLIVLSHLPLVDQSARITMVGGKNAGTLENGPTLLTELAARREVVLCFTGHQHFHHVARGRNWLHVTTASLAEYPAEYRIIHVDLDARRVDVVTRSAIDEALVAAARAESPWVVGEANDRECSWGWSLD